MRLAIGDFADTLRIQGLSDELNETALREIPYTRLNGGKSIAFPTTQILAPATSKESHSCSG